ncbi:hypothetical protein K474DRAFT_1709762 [Panus rudis PR-1116 ss-1]|nr:hypothetical protein K474DRAFT_1709762 [Panus rudis PR-1116 ss-1]
MTRLLGRSRLAKAWLGNTTSSKFNFIISEVKLYSAREKFLIFSRSPLTLAYVNKQLELIGIKALHFTSKVELRVREQYVTTFETSDTYRLPDGTEARCSSLHAHFKKANMYSRQLGRKRRILRWVKRQEYPQLGIPSYHNLDNTLRLLAGLPQFRSPSPPHYCVSWYTASRSPPPGSARMALDDLDLHQ